MKPYLKKYRYFYSVFNNFLFVNVILFVFTFGLHSIDYVSSKKGNWNNSTSWDPKGTPGIGDNVSISHEITTDVSRSINSLTLISGGILNVGTNSISISADLVNSGSIVYSGAGTLSLSGSLTNTGTLTLASSTVNFTGANSASSTVSAFTTTGPVNFTRTAGTVTFAGNVNAAAFTINGTGVTVNLGTGLNHTFTGAVTLTAGTLNGGSSTLNANLTGTAWTYNGGTFTAGTGTVNFNGANQTIGGTQTTVFNNLTLSGTGTKTLPTYALTINGNLGISGSASVTPTNAVNVGGNFSLDNTASFSAGSLSHGIGGNFTNNSTFTPGTSTITMNGTSAQIIGGTTTPASFYNLTIGNDTVVTLASNHRVDVTNNLQINSGALLEIGTERLVEANRIVNNAGAGGLIIKASSSVANGSLIFYNSDLETVEGTVEMYTKAYYDAAGPTGFKYKWQYFGIPLQSLATANPTFAGSFVRRYNEPGTGSAYWVTVTNTTSMSAFNGYQITQVSPKTITFSGILENRTLSRDLTYTSGAAIPGQHVLANPYTAAIDIKKIEFGTDMNKTVFLFNTGSKTDWETQNATDWTAGQYLTVPQNQAGQGSLPQSIPSMQGFIVSTKTPHVLTNITIPYEVDSLMKNVQTLRVNRTIIEKSFSIVTVEGTRYLDKMWLFTEPGTTPGFDNGWDGQKILGSTLKPQIYAIGTDGNYQVNTVSDINNTTLGFRAGEDTQYTITFDHTNTDSKYQEIYLTDLVTGATTDISLSGSQYTFTTSGTVAGPRFSISAVKKANEEVEEEDNDVIVVEPVFKLYYANGNLVVNNPSEQAGKVHLYDLRNHVVNSYNFGGNSLNTFPLDLPTGIYLAKAAAGKLKKNETIIIK